MQWKRTPELHALGRALLELRARRGLSQEALAFAAGMQRNYIGALEAGAVAPLDALLEPCRLARGVRQGRALPSERLRQASR